VPETISVDPIACEAYGYCAELLPELVGLDEWGYPIVAVGEVPPELLDVARWTMRQCPTRAIRMRAAVSRTGTG
jgi:ferredoxin